MRQCDWCGGELPKRAMARTRYCCKACASSWHDMQRNEKKQKVVEKYGSHAFDAWVAKCWNGSGVRGHSITV